MQIQPVVHKWKCADVWIIHPQTARIPHTRKPDNKSLWLFGGVIGIVARDPRQYSGLFINKSTIVSTSKNTARRYIYERIYWTCYICERKSSTVTAHRCVSNERRMHITHTRSIDEGVPVGMPNIWTLTHVSSLNCSRCVCVGVVARRYHIRIIIHCYKSEALME